MSIRTVTITITRYEIKCDYCGMTEYVDTSYKKNVYNRRQAVRSIGWTLQREDKVKCNTCRCYKKNTYKKRRIKNGNI